MVDPVLAAARLRVMDGLDAVAVWVADEGAVVARRVLRPRPGRAVVGEPGTGHRPPPRVDLLAGVGDERDVEVAGRQPLLARPRDREVFPLVEVPIGGRLPVAERA